MSQKTILSEKELGRFHSDGFTYTDQITTPEDVAYVREIFDQMFQDKRGREEGNQFDLAGSDEEGKEASLPQIKDPARYAPELNDSKLLENASRALSQLFGEPVQASFYHAIFKPPKHGAETPWHQDAAYWDPNYIHRKISVWVPLQEVTVENGCMQFVPKTDNEDIMIHQSINNDPTIHGLELLPEKHEELADKAVPCPLPAGGASFHGGYAPHYAGPNFSDNPRRAIILVGELPPIERNEKMRFPWLEERQTARLQRKQSGTG